MEADDEILIYRILERGKNGDKEDDKDENKVRNRFKEYNDKTFPLIEYYKNQNKFHSVSAIGTVTDITKSLSSLLD